MLCHEYRCIFVHIPKVAGQSIEHVFLELLGLTWETRAPLLLRPNSDPELGPALLAHLKASEYVSCGHIGQEQFDTYFKFSFVRNPWDRMVSFYKYLGYSKKMSFQKYLFKQFIKDDLKNKYWLVGPQYEFLYDERNTRLVDSIGRYESLHEDFNRVSRCVGIPEYQLRHINKSGVDKPMNSQSIIQAGRYFRKLIEEKMHRKNTFGHYTDYYDNESRQLVAELYKKDIEFFDYEFGN